MSTAKRAIERELDENMRQADKEDDQQIEHAKMMQACNPEVREQRSQVSIPAYFPKAVLKGVIGELISVLKKARFSMYSPEMIKEIEEAIKKYEQYSE